MLRRAIVAATLAISSTAIAVIPTTPAMARACRIDHFCYTDYYSDATHTTLVGGKFEDCDGEIRTWGRRTGSYTWSETPC